MKASLTKVTAATGEHLALVGDHDGVSSSGGHQADPDIIHHNVSLVRTQMSNLFIPFAGCEGNPSGVIDLGILKSSKTQFSVDCRSPTQHLEF